ncbi:DUF3533 domain-containing protein [Diaminobutyricibacter tongyongensis]|uniref:DUF3533 domain-containing protein n=1 Tax=Leifsonia tongyongensis TaxID=1268043 RepID=A0A6L9XYC6_9MICO|nr:DUF3533 domain-containing protein [Diaminobutyricibacter tongyongensis]NEN06442.1 DUF3533 domain-containing protein [Diaminobutyricibacter tongyongensis]
MTRRSRIRRLAPGSHLPALVVTLIIAAVAALFAASYSLAMADPKPHDVPIGLVSSAVTPTQLRAALAEPTTTTTFRITTFPTTADALAAIQDQRIYGALADDGTSGRLYVSSASGDSVARLLEADAPALETAFGHPVTVEDTHPLSPGDPSGLVLFYVPLVAVIIGFLGAVQTRTNAAKLTIRGELSWDLVRSVLAAFAIVLSIGVILRIMPMPFLPAWGVPALTMLVAGMTYNVFRMLIGARWALLPTWVVFVLISNPASGGAVAPSLLPPFYEFIGRWMPTGAAVNAIRDLAYFPGNLHAEPYIVLGAWLVVTTTLFVALRLYRFGPGVPGDAVNGFVHRPAVAEDGPTSDTTPNPIVTSK